MLKTINCTLQKGEFYGMWILYQFFKNNNGGKRGRGKPHWMGSMDAMDGPQARQTIIRSVLIVGNLKK